MHIIGHYSPVIGGEASVVCAPVTRCWALVASTSPGSRYHRDHPGGIDCVQRRPGPGVALPSQPALPATQRPDAVRSTPPPPSKSPPAPTTVAAFPVLPMAFTPNFDVVVDQPDHLRFAAEAVNLMGQQTLVTLQPRLTNLAAAVGSGARAAGRCLRGDLARAGTDPAAAAGKGQRRRHRRHSDHRCRPQRPDRRCPSFLPTRPKGIGGQRSR